MSKQMNPTTTNPAPPTVGRWNSKKWSPPEELWSMMVLWLDCSLWVGCPGLELWMPMMFLCPRWQFAQSLLSLGA